jgi:hypothetical protein
MEGKLSGCIARAVLVRVDREVDTAACDLCSVAGVELSAAPRRPPAFRRRARLPACSKHHFLSPLATAVGGQGTVMLCCACMLPW